MISIKPLHAFSQESQEFLLLTDAFFKEIIDSIKSFLNTFLILL